MNIREQLEDLKDYVKAQPNHRARHVHLIEQLIAERPYEPGDEINVSMTNDFSNAESRIFICVAPPPITKVVDHVICYEFGSDPGLKIWPYHRPIPKTHRLKPVPEEVIDDAKEARKAFGLVAHGNQSEVKGFKALEWLANPENWEE